MEQVDALRDAGRCVLIERALSAADASAGLALSDAAGWNQTAEDWRYLLGAGLGFGVDGDGDGALVATAMTVPYGPFGWISMVLVREDLRGRGLATALMRRCIATLRDADAVAILDATPAGREVYRRLGFRDAWTLRRLRRTGPAAPPAAAPPPGVILRALRDADLDAVAAFDRDAFGASREPLLRRLRARLPAAALVAERDGAIAGFALARDGRRAAQLGPVVAADRATGAALVARALAAIDGAVIADVPDVHGGLQTALRRAGFAEERPFTRMVLDREGAFDDPGRIAAIAGPELG